MAELASAMNDAVLNQDVTLTATNTKTGVVVTRREMARQPGRDHHHSPESAVRNRAEKRSAEIGCNSGACRRRSPVAARRAALGSCGETGDAVTTPEHAEVYLA